MLSGSVDGSADFHVDDDLDVYVNGALVYSDNTPPATPSARSPINFIADTGDTLRLVVRDTYGDCASLKRLFLTDAIGRRTLVDPGFDLGCGRPTGNQGVVHDLTLPIPNLAPVPAFDEVVLPGSAFAGVVPGPNGLLYGATYDGGASNKGTVYAFDPWLSSVTLGHSFDGAGDGSTPYGEMTFDGLLYGVTIYGGVLCNPANPLYGCGTVFRLKPVLPGDTDAQFQTLHQFQYHRGDPCPDPPAPYCVEFPVNCANYPQGKPIVGSDGFPYGTTFYRLFSLDPANPGTSFKFIATDGGGVSLAAIEGADTRLYVADYGGGPAGAGSVFSLNRDGTAPSGLHDFSFASGLESYGPYGRPYRDAVGTVFGTTEYMVDSPYHGVVYAVSGAVAPPPERRRADVEC